MPHTFLALSCVALLLTIAAQNLWWPPLRNETISAGLTGRYHVLLDASYLPLSVALCLNFRGHIAMEIFAWIAALALLLVAATNTAWRWFDALTDGGHSKLHSAFTLVVFTSALALQVAGDSGWRWGMTIANVVVPAMIYAYFHVRPTVIRGVTVQASPAAEKAYVTLLCLWLIV